MNLSQEMKHWNKIDCADSLSGFFAAMNMPLPEKGQFTRTRDKGALVFLDEPACVMRLIDRVKFPSIVHPLVLQPLFKKDVGPFRIEICPGIASPPREEDMIVSARQLIADKIHFPSFLEIREDNFGYLPATLNQPRVAVVLDMDAIEDRRSEKLSSENRQSEIFAPAVRAFQNAWPDDALVPDAGKLQQAWKVCAGLKQDGVCVAGWQASTYYGGDYKGAKSSGINYAAAWI